MRLKNEKSTSFFGEMFRNRYQDSCTIGCLGFGRMGRCSTMLFDNELLKFDYVNTFDLPQHWFSLEKKNRHLFEKVSGVFTGSMEIGVGCRMNHFPIWTSHQTHSEWLILCLKILFHNTSPWWYVPVPVKYVAWLTIFKNLSAADPELKIMIRRRLLDLKKKWSTVRPFNLLFKNEGIFRRNEGLIV